MKTWRGISLGLFLAGSLLAQGAWAGEWIADAKGCKVWNPNSPASNVAVMWDGGCEGGYANGDGVMQWLKDGKPGVKYVGEYKNGHMSGKGSYTWPDGNNYKGDFVEDYFAGKGVLTWANGDRYEGEFVKDKRTGQGVFIWSNGNRYEGDYFNNKRTGKGTFIHANGSKYVGDFVDGLETGKGSIIWADGDRYEGDFVGGKRTGKGVFIWKDGGRYDGGFLNGKLSGKGVYVWQNGNRYEGDFVEGKRTGKGVFTWPNGQRYAGGFVDNYREGYGVYSWPNGERYEGGWVKGNMQGYGEKKLRNGAVDRGIWAADKLERSCSSNAKCEEMKAELSLPIANCKVYSDKIGKEYRGECLNGLAHGKGRAAGEDVYYGDFNNGKMHGRGTYTWKDGDRYVGDFVEGRKTGVGSYEWRSGNEYKGDFVDGNFSGYGVKTYKCNCGFISCKTCTDQGWWKEDKLVRSCNSKNACMKLNELEPLIKKAEGQFRCEDAKKLNRELEALKSSVFSYDYCVRERSFNQVLNSKNAQEMYLAAGRYESDGERSRAKTIYQKIVSRFAKNPIAIKATDRLTRLADVEAVESASRNASYQVERSNSQVRDAAYQQCMNDWSACNNRCDQIKNSSSRSSCKSGCSFCSR